MAAIETVHLYAYLGRYTNNSMATGHRYFREVRCFFNWLIAAGYLEETPFRALRNVRLPQRIVRPFSPAEVARLLACCDPASYIGARDQAIPFTLLDTGIRCSELVQLNLEDLDLAEGRLRVPELGSLRCRGFLLFEPKLDLADLVDKLTMTIRSHDP